MEDRTNDKVIDASSECDKSPDRDERTKDPLTEKEKQIVDLTNGLKRLQAEFENFKKRMEKDWSERVRLAGERLVLDLLTVLDTYEKALEDAKRNQNVDRVKEGFERVHRQFLQTLQREGLKEVRAAGRFDPFVHEAVQTEETEEEEDGMILEVLQKGYALGNKVIRPARVKVARRRSEEHEALQDDNSRPPEGGSQQDSQE